MKPRRTSSASSRSDRMPLTISSETSAPEAITALAWRPIRVPAETAARNMSPIETWTMPRSSASICACVPLPAPGGPSRMMFISELPLRARGALPPPRALQFGLLDEVAILVGDEVALDLGHRIHRHVDDDQQAGAAEAERQAHLGDRIFRQQADDGEVGGAEHGAAGQHVIEILLGALAGSD